MDKVLSARVDESILARIEMLARELRVTKKKIIEDAIVLLEKNVREGRSLDILDRTFGAWKRKESPRRTVSRARRAFRESMHRHRR